MAAGIFIGLAIIATVKVVTGKRYHFTKTGMIVLLAFAGMATWALMVGR